MPHKRLTIALAGNPNSGKTTIFNSLTGTRQKVGNWAGVTVEKKEGIIVRDDYEIKVVDLPGTYSLTPFSVEEVLARNYIIDEAPDLVINIIDASNLERSLYLATQVRELDCKVLFALNMEDLARARGLIIDADKLAELLDVAVVFTVANKGQGIEALLAKTIQVAASGAPTQPERRVRYNKDVETAIAELQQFLDRYDNLFYNSRWIAIKLLENDRIVRERMCAQADSQAEALLEKVDDCRRHLTDIYDDDPEIIMTDERYGFITGLVKEVVFTTKVNRIDISRNIDLVLTNRFFGFPLFIFFIWLMFQMTFTLGAYPMAWIETGFSLLSAGADILLPAGLWEDLIIDGVLSGVGSVAVFLPNILILFFCIALFEDTGYMARAAFLMDRIMHLIGLHGKSFIPMLMGFGCSVPAIMATRTLENRKDRILTILITPFMSCSARLPIYIVLAGTFFPKNAGTVIFGIYLTGIVVAIGSGRLFRSTLLRGEDAPFVMELPPYRAPMLKSILIHMWDRARIFLKKMGGIILVGSIVVWFLSTFPQPEKEMTGFTAQRESVQAEYVGKLAAAGGTEERQALEAARQEKMQEIQQAREKAATESVFLGRIGKAIAPVFEPVGIDWRGSVALLTGFVAKEIVVSSLGVLYATGSDEPGALRQALLSSGMTRASALAMMVFVLLYIPCIATVSAVFRETGAWQWAVFNIIYTTGIAWVGALMVYNAGKMMGIG